MTNEARRIIRDGFGAIEDELRSQRGQLEYIIKLLGGGDAKLQAVREDVAQLQESRSEHERELSKLREQFASLSE